MACPTKLGPHQTPVETKPWWPCPHPWLLPRLSLLIGTSGHREANTCFCFPGLIFPPSNSPPQLTPSPGPESRPILDAGPTSSLLPVSQHSPQNNKLSRKTHTFFIIFLNVLKKKSQEIYCFPPSNKEKCYSRKECPCGKSGQNQGQRNDSKMNRQLSTTHRITRVIFSRGVKGTVAQANHISVWAQTNPPPQRVCRAQDTASQSAQKTGKHNC